MRPFRALSLLVALLLGTLPISVAAANDSVGTTYYAMLSFAGYTSDGLTALPIEQSCDIAPHSEVIRIKDFPERHLAEYSDYILVEFRTPAWGLKPCDRKMYGRVSDDQWQQYRRNYLQR